jgi:hypothetical protein
MQNIWPVATNVALGPLSIEPPGRSKRVVGSTGGVEVGPDNIRQVAGKAHKLIADPLYPGLLAIKVEWCKYCKDLDREVKAAMGWQPFPFYWMNGDAIPARWKMRDMGVDSFPSLFLVLPDGTLCPYGRGRKAESLLAAVRLAESG